MNYLKTSKKLFLTGLIMIMALSLLTIGCANKEDESSTPTTPTGPITITAADLTDSVSQALAAVGNSGATLSGFNPSNGTASVTATITSEVTLANLKTELETALNVPLVVSPTAVVTVPNSNSGKEAVTVDLTIKSMDTSTAVLDSSMTEYTYNASDGSASVKITITPDKNWNNS